MSEETQDLQQDELTTLKARADQMGITYHPSIGAEKLKEKIDAKLVGAEEPAATQAPEIETENQFRLRKRREAEQLVRVQVTCMNPNKREWEGEVFSAGNAIVPTIKKYVPFDVEWHVPRIILNQLKGRECQVFVTRRENGRQIREGKTIREFNVVELPPLTEKELKELAQRQAMASGSAQ